MSEIELDEEKQKNLVRALTLLSLAVEWIEKEFEFSDNDLNRFRNIFPDEYELLKNLTFEELIEINSRHRDNPIYREQIDVVLSENGRKWLNRTLLKVHEFSAKHD